MAAGSVVVSKTRKPSAEESKEMVHVLEAINKKLTSVMQGTVQMVSVTASRSKICSTYGACVKAVGAGCLFCACLCLLRGSVHLLV